MTSFRQPTDLAGARIVFDLTNLYYLPQFLPVCEELVRRGAECRFLFYSRAADENIFRHPVKDLVARDTGCPVDVVAFHQDDQREALAYYNRQCPDWIVFGNEFAPIVKLDSRIRTVMLYHGIGVKETYYRREQMMMDIRFVEGEHREAILRQRYPERQVLAVGFAKLDPLFSENHPLQQFDLERAGLDPARPTILYAPTFYPSSMECLADDWPAAMADCNLIVKPHQYAWTLRRHRGQLRKLESWQRYPNVYIADACDYSLLPFMQAADVLVSEASSALFEFAALDRPVVWCDFMKLRLGHRGIFRFRLLNRMDRTIDAFRDIGAHARTPAELPDVIRGQLADPSAYRAARQAYVNELLGPVDGRASERIADHMLHLMAWHHQAGQDASFKLPVG